MISEPRRIRNGTFRGEPGTWWAWQVDGYWDIHHSYPGEFPDGSDVVSEFHSTLAEVKHWVKEVAWLERYQ